jgi:tetratricopeptide (TPR) repeat protein
MTFFMKKALILCILLQVAILCISGCTQIHHTPEIHHAPEVQPLSDMMPPGPSGPDPQTSARYHYLKFLMLHQQNRIEPALAALETAIAIDPDSGFLKRDLIRIHLALGQEEAALALALALAEQHPEDVENLLMLVRLKNDQIREDQIQEDQMHRLLEQILELDPENKETYLRLGRIYMENQQFPEALELFSRMTARLPDYYVAHFYLGEALLVSGKYNEAEHAFLKTIDLEPNLVEPRFRLADIYRDPANPAGPVDPEQIMDIYGQILEIEPENDRARLEMALLLHQTGRTAKAENLFIELGKEARHNTRLLMTAVDLFISQKRHKDAVIVFSRMQKADPDNDNLNFFLGLAYESDQNPEQAVHHYLKVTPAHPQYKKTLFSIAFLYREMGWNEKAVTFLEGHHNKKPGDIDIISYLSAFYERDGHLEKAMNLLSKGLADAPENTALLFRLGAVQDKAGRKDACIATMKEVIRLDPDDASALNYLGYTYADLGIHLDQAEILIKKAMEIKPDDGYIIDSMGWVYYQQGQYEKAVVYLERAADLTAFESIIASHLADAYVKTGRLASALEAYRKAVANAKEEDADLILEVEQKIQQLEQRSAPPSEALPEAPSEVPPEAPTELPTEAFSDTPDIEKSGPKTP